MPFQNINNLNEIKKHLKHIVLYMEKTKDLESACRFVVPCCFLEYLAKLYYGRILPNDNKANDKSIYLKFVNEIFIETNPKYKTFEYDNREIKLGDQMYLILRCGIVHAFSLTPNRRRNTVGKLRSIILADKNDELEHLANFSNEFVEDSCIFKLEEFINDLDKSLDSLFHKAESDMTIAKNITDWTDDYPFIGALTY